MPTRLTLFALVLFAVGTARAQETPELVTDRPDQTESAATVPQGWVQFEGGYEYSNLEPTLSLLGRVGVLRNFELRVGYDFGNQPIFIGGKVRLWGGGQRGPELAVLASTDFGIDRNRYGEVRLALAQPLSETLNLGANVGSTFYSYPGVLNADILYTLALGIDVSERVGAFAEVYGEGEWPGAAAGLTYLVVPNLQLDVSGRHALRGSGYFVGVGASFRLPR